MAGNRQETWHAVTTRYIQVYIARVAKGRQVRNVSCPCHCSHKQNMEEMVYTKWAQAPCCRRVTAPPASNPR